MESAAKALFTETFESGSKRDEDQVCVTAPGRVNLIGEHTDYNDGFVMPLALEKATVAVGRLREDNLCKIVSALNDKDVVTFTLEESSFVPGEDKSWAKYVKGVIKQYLEDLNKVGAGKVVGFEAAFASDVPLGGGLSSSASLEVCTATLLECLYGVTSVSPVDRALRCVEAEHTFAMVPCGIMDQFISSCAVQGCALLIDCRSKETTKVDMSDSDICILVTNSNHKHELSGSEYPDRVRQCKEAVQAIDAAFGSDGKKRTHLRDVSLEELEEVYKKGAVSEVVYKRARHGISEDARTLKAKDAAQANDYEAVGKLMVESHNSLRDDYEVSIPEIDFLVEVAVKQDGVLGSRITGGGFGGCTVSLVKKEAVDPVMAALTEAYKEKFGLECTCFATNLGAGARVLWDNRTTAAKKARNE